MLKDSHHPLNLASTSITSGLTARQGAIVRLLSLGCSIEEAAQILKISARTADNHKNRAMTRLGLHKVALLARFAIESGLSPHGDMLSVEERSALGGRTPSNAAASGLDRQAVVMASQVPG